MSRSWYDLIFVGLFVGKLTCLAALGPQWTGDTTAYVGFAKQILSDPDWLLHASFSSDNYLGNLTTIRMVGYPLLLAGSMCLSPDSWDWLIAGFQIIVAVSTTYLLYRVLNEVSGNRVFALVLAMAQAIGVNFALDAAILTDSLCLSLLIVITCLAVRMGHSRRIKPVDLIVIALGFVACFMLREASTILGLLWAPALWAAFRGAGRSTIAAASLVIITFLPMLVAEQGYKAWNRQRTGTAFVTTSMQWTLLYPLVIAKRSHPELTIGSPLIDELLGNAIAERQPGFYHEVGVVNRELTEKLGLTPPQIAEEAKRSFVAAWIAHPLVMAIGALSIVTPGSVTLVSPLSARNFMQSHISNFDAASRSDSLLARRRAFTGAPTWSWLLIYAVQVPLVLLSLAMLGVYAVTTLLLTTNPGLRALPLGDEILALAVLPAGFLGFHSLVYVEPRYLMPAIPVIFVIIAWSFRHRIALVQPLMMRLYENKQYQWLKSFFAAFIVQFGSK